MLFYCFTEKTMSDDFNPKPLWTRDFTIITLGSVVSMFGNAMSGFAMSLMVLDISESTLLYSIYIAMFTLPQLIMPIVSGALLDRFSRKKTIYTLDFISAGLYLLMSAGHFQYGKNPVATCCVILICLNQSVGQPDMLSIYSVLLLLYPYIFQITHNRKNELCYE